MKITKLYILIAGLIFSCSLSAQQVEEEVEFLYIKAKYLYDTDRDEDAVNAFNKVIKKNPSYKDALVLRAASKYGLAAYKGALNDLNESLKVRGVSPDAVSWLALTYYKLDKTDLATTTLASAIVLDPKNPKIWILKGDMAEEDGNKLSACNSWEKAASLGDTQADRKLTQYCGRNKSSVKKKYDRKNPNVTDKDEMLEDDEVISLGETNEDTTVNDNDEMVEEDEVLSLGDEEETTEPSAEEEEEVLSLGDKEDESTDENEAKPDRDLNEKNIIEIDEELTLEIYGEGLGSRKILDQPNILILAEEDGTVAVNICVGRTGSVKKAEYNDELSTIKKQSLISLAIRKAKEFWFAKDRQKEMCGVILYKIKGS